MSYISLSCDVQVLVAYRYTSIPHWGTHFKTIDPWDGSLLRDSAQTNANLWGLSAVYEHSASAEKQHPCRRRTPCIGKSDTNVCGHAPITQWPVLQSSLFSINYPLYYNQVNQYFSGDKGRYYRRTFPPQFPYLWKLWKFCITIGRRSVTIREIKQPAKYQES